MEARSRESIRLLLVPRARAGIRPTWPRCGPRTSSRGRASPPICSPASPTCLSSAPMRTTSRCPSQWLSFVAGSSSPTASSSRRLNTWARSRAASRTCSSGPSADRRWMGSPSRGSTSPRRVAETVRRRRSVRPRIPRRPADGAGRPSRVRAAQFHRRGRSDRRCPNQGRDRGFRTDLRPPAERLGKCGTGGMLMQLRIARHTERLEELVRFYRDGIGLREVGRFHDHAGYDGVFLAVDGSGGHRGSPRGAARPHPNRTRSRCSSSTSETARRCGQ